MSSPEQDSSLGLPGVQKIREFLGLTQDQLAKEVNITTRWLSAVENGFKDCKLGVARSFARILHCKIADLLTTEHEPEKLQTIKDLYESEQAKKKLEDIAKRDKAREKSRAS
jgi:DNA-binding XRE family transcriptional regulator